MQRLVLLVCMHLFDHYYWATANLGVNWVHGPEEARLVHEVRSIFATTSSLCHQLHYSHVRIQAGDVIRFRHDHNVLHNLTYDPKHYRNIVRNAFE
jgi:hypothetical protein